VYVFIYSRDISENELYKAITQRLEIIN